MKSQDIEANGDCQFLSVAQEVLLQGMLKSGNFRCILDEERDRLAETLRAEAVAYMKNNSELVSSFIAPQEGPYNPLDGGTDKNLAMFCLRLSEKGEYGDTLTLRALALALKMKIQLFLYMPQKQKIQVIIMPSKQGENAGEGVEPSAEMVEAKVGTLSIVFWKYQYGGPGHFDTFMTTKVKRTLDS